MRGHVVNTLRHARSYRSFLHSQSPTALFFRAAHKLIIIRDQPFGIVGGGGGVKEKMLLNLDLQLNAKFPLNTSQ